MNLTLAISKLKPLSVISPRPLPNSFFYFIGFQIGNEDADAIFDDLDHDGDGRISFEDFSFGFRDFLTPGAKRGNAQLTTLATTSPAPVTPKSRAPSFR